MQLSSNSNAAILGIIYSCPTAAGQWRQAMIQGRDRRIALENYSLDRRKLLAEIELKQDELLQSRRLQRPSAERELIQIEIERKEIEIQRCDELVEDAARELACCEAEAQRICEQAGIVFGELDAEQFQDYMVLDYQAKQVRWGASQVLAGVVGCSVDYAEHLLELPEEERAAYMQRVNGYVLPMLPMPEEIHE